MVLLKGIYTTARKNSYKNFAASATLAKVCGLRVLLAKIVPHLIMFTVFTLL